MAQPPDTLWTKIYGLPDPFVEYGWSVLQASDEGYVISGAQGTEALGWIWLLKTDSNGDTLWTRAIWPGGSISSYGYCIKQTDDGGYIIAGAAGNNYRLLIYLVKTNDNGDTLWTKILGQEFPSNTVVAKWVSQTTDGGFILTGLFYSYQSNSWDIFLVKTDGNGAALWSKSYGSSEYEQGYCVQQTSDGGYIISGRTGQFDNIGDVWLLKTDANGDTLWTRVYGDSMGSQQGFSVHQILDDGYIIGAESSYGGMVDSSFIYVIRTDANGDTLWTKTYGHTQGNFYNLRSLQPTSDGGYIIVGYVLYNDTTLRQNLGDIYLMKISANGDSLWATIYDICESEYGFSIQQTTDGGYIITGYGSNVGSQPDLLLIKTNSEMDIAEFSYGQVRPSVLAQTYPNPFTHSTWIEYHTVQKARANITVYNSLGQQICTLVDVVKPAGSHQVIWDGTDKFGKVVDPGIYFIQVKIADCTLVNKVCYLR